MIWALTEIPEFVSLFRSLDTLVLDNLIVDYSGGCGVSFEWITGVLQKLSSPIRKLVFEVTATSYLQLKRIPWASIEGVVSLKISQFRELVRVEVFVRRGVHQTISPASIGRDVVLAEIMQSLPGLNRLGLLRCDTKEC